MKKRIKIIIIALIIVIILAIVLSYFFFFSKSSMFSFMNPDFSAGAGALDKAAGAGNANAFENTKLNPFENSS